MNTSASKMETVAAHLAREPRVTVLDLDYLHLRLDDGSDLYVTEYGRPFSVHLLPENHHADRDWFAAHNVKLPGTSALYKVTTKAVEGLSKDIVLKWNRMGQDIPGETQASDLANAEFNSPFEEFGLVMELRNTRFETPGRIYTHKPLAIYVPRRYVEAERMGRKHYRIEALQRRHDEITLDANRQYAVVYEWIGGIDAATACARGLIDESAMTELILRSRREMRRKGYRVRDSKAHHIIVRPTPDGGLAGDGHGETLYALVDFELLCRTPDREHAMRALKRKTYLVRQAHRFEAKASFPPGLTSTSTMGVDYVHGHVESTTGALWVVGKDPVLFEYFLPEKWRKTPRTSLSPWREIYYTVTKDNIHLVWQVSRVGRRPDEDRRSEKGKRIIAHGYNSPFEEVALSLELARNGIETTYPRAIYMTRHKLETAGGRPDKSRYGSHQAWATPDGHPILSEDHDYMIIWGYWNGPDDQLAAKDEQVYEAVNALDAYRGDRITEDVYRHIMRTTADRLAAHGIEDLNLAGSHLLLSLDRSGQLVTDGQGLPTVRICNFELLRHTRPSDLHHRRTAPSAQPHA